MKLALLAPENSPSWGGVGSYTYNLANNLPKDIEIHIITIDRDVNDSYEKIIKNENVKIHKITKVSANDSFFYNPKFQMALFRKIRKLNQTYNFDLIHSHSGHLPHYFSQFWNLAPMIVTVHTETRGWKEARNLVKYNKDRIEIMSDLVSPFISFGEKVTFKRSQMLLPISQFTLNQINDLYGVNTDGRAQVIHNGVNTDLFKSLEIENNDKITISFLGRFISIKGAEIFLDSIKKINNNGYDIRVLLGGRADAAYLKRILPSMQDKISYFGRIPYHEMPNVYNKSDIVVVPSLYEGCSGTILEAMACGNIVIASDVGGTSEIIEDGHNGILFKPRDSFELSNKIIDVIEENIEINSIRKNGMQNILNNFSWQDKAKEVYESYSKLV
ncbi:glycosyltransferase family 4 protein [Methanobacterium sp.]|uniref:glycosyltransferase family 4 protein n=1 Tax=Methanobacterium sp. TaxID=2164 RepID=UPI003C76564C